MFVFAFGWDDHGTAVVGVMSATPNAYGVTGLVPAAEVQFFTEMSVEEGPALWSMTVPIGADAPAVFTMAMARRMWAAVRGAGLWSRMAQWKVPSHASHSRMEYT